MSGTVRLDAPVAANTLFDYLTDPHSRPAWQSSLRSVADVRGSGALGTTWIDVTAVGARPAMQVTASERPRLWIESGRWRWLTAVLRLDLLPYGPEQTRITATFSIIGEGPFALPAMALERVGGAPCGWRRRAEPARGPRAKRPVLLEAEPSERPTRPMQSVVHLVRHGKVQNPDGILYGRLPGFGLSEVGRAMAERLGEHFADVPLTHLRCSPLQRAQETMEPIARKHPELPIITDERVIEAANYFEGRNFGRFNQLLLLPQNLWQLRNPLRPSWGEAYTSIVARVRSALTDAAAAAGDGGQALIVMHELPIWISRLAAEGRSLVHDPRKRECRLASVTSFTLIDDRIVAVDYAEPAADLVPPKTSKILFRPGS